VLNFSYESNIKARQLIEIFDKFPLLLKMSPPQIKYTILDEKNRIIQQKFFVNTIQKEITLEIVYSKISDDSFLLEVISGPAKGSRTTIKISEKLGKSVIGVALNLKLALRYKIFSSVLSKKIKSVNITLFNRLEILANLLYNNKHQISFENNYDILVIHLDDKKIYFGGWWLGDVWSSFIGETYAKLPCKNKVVIDIGANIADTAISFVHRGAKKVIALEPFPINYEFAKSNISKNNMDEQIEVIPGGCSSNSSQILIDPKLSGLSYKMVRTDTGEKIRQFTLEELVKKFDIVEGVIKMNCEGCEYETIRSTPDDILRRFSHILIQYHQGTDPLTNKLSGAGFQFSIEKYSENKGQLIAENLSSNTR
jgi:FkbM family methyltransferase